MNVRELHADALCDDPLFAARVDEQQIFLPVVVEAEVVFRLARAREGYGRRGRRARIQAPRRRAKTNQPARLQRRVVGHEAAHALDCFHGDAAADLEPADELAVVNGAASEGRFGHAYPPAVVGNFVEQLLRRHPVSPS